MEEILRYLGIKDNNISSELKQKIDLIKKEFIYKCRPKSIFYEIENIDIFNSKGLKKHLESCERFFLFAATLGTEADSIIRRYLASDISNAAIAQAVATWYIEKFCDEEMDNFNKGNLFFKPRFSPGYADFNIEYQRYILDISNATKRLGITLSDGLMMIPEKSVTAVLGLSKNNNCIPNKCKDCNNTNCEYRRVTGAIRTTP